MDTAFKRARESDWQLSAPGEQGVDPVLLAAAYDEAAKFQPLRSMLVARHGRLVGEHYFGRYHQDSAFNIKSASKSVISALVGIALHQKLLPGLDQPIATWFPEYAAMKDARKVAITLRHLLTMSAGLGWIENAGNIRRWHGSPDWVQYALDLPLVQPPGQQFNYNTTLSHLASAILARASGMSTLQFAETFLFRPLGVKVVRWKTDPQGYHVGGSDICLTARGMLTFGQLYLQQGEWEGQSIIPAAWVAETTRPQMALRQPGFWHPAYTAYGYYWWLRPFQGHAAYVASGYAGQMIFVVPDLDVVAVTTADADVPFSSVMKQSNMIEDIVAEFVIPSIQEADTNGTSHA